MQKTPLYNQHISLGAKMVPFAGFAMPLEYAGIPFEHMAVRENLGIFDVSHMGTFWVKGPHAFDFLQKVSSNDLSLIKPGRVQYTCLTNENPGIVDDLLIYHYEAEKYLLVVNASNISKDWEWLNKHNNSGAILEDASKRMALIAVQGPKAQAVLQKLTAIELNDIPSYSFKTGMFADIDDVIISNTGYTGAGGFELYVNDDQAEKLWTSIMSAGSDEGIVPAGLGARDTLRLEMGYCLYGNDIDETTSTLEAGLAWITKFVDNKPFIGREKLEKQKNEGLKRRLRWFVLEEKGIPRKDYEIINEEGENIGIVTSGTISLVLKRGIGMGYIDSGFGRIGDMVYIRIRNRAIKAKIVKPPFI